MKPEAISRGLVNWISTRKGSLVFSHGAGSGIVGGLRESYTGSARALYEWSVREGLDATWLHASASLPFAAGRTAPFKSIRGLTASMRAHVSVGGSNNGVPWPILSDRTWVVQCWHGAPLKRIGRAWPGSIPRDLEIVERADLFISSGPEYTKRFRRCYAVDEERFWETGNPRNDRLVTATDDERARLREELRAACGMRDVERIVLFAPTWREWITDPRFLDVPDQSIDRLRAFLEAHDALLILRPHHREARIALEQGWHEGRIRVSDMLDLPWEVNDWQIAADVLVTDYSSIFFDFLNLDRPIVHVVADLEDYASHRGFMVDPEEDFAGAAVRTQAGLMRALEEAFADPDAHAARRAEVSAIHNPLEDGYSSERVGRRLIELLESDRRSGRAGPRSLARSGVR